MKYKWLPGMAVAVLAVPAWGANEPIIAMPGEWVATVVIPEADSERANAPVQALLTSSQARYGEEWNDYYVETANLVQNPQGLAALGTIAIPWDPDRFDLIVHKVHIIRGDIRIDLLANGQEFTVIRRENNLEQAMLNGTLTAVIQPEGLTVGDIVNLAFTVREKPGPLGLSAENFLFLTNTEFPIRLAQFRQVWPDDIEMRWHATPAMGTPEIEQTGLGTELLLELEDVTAPQLPKNAPPRYWFPAFMQLTEYQDWSDISRIMAPLYAEARTLKTDSPLKAEIERIASQSAEPARRTMAALRLVQDKIRYVALSMGDGGYVPASADQTWARKFGDCKGKTVTLLALLDGLGIDAEPVAVSTAFGDGLDDRLPQVGLFDHVIVRARIDGQSYWLDGTQVGDRQLQALESSPFGWGLPLRADGASLETLPLKPPSVPLIEMQVTYDASAGFEFAVPVAGRILTRGDLATMLRIGLETYGEEKLRDMMLNMPGPDFPEQDDIRTFEVENDEANGTLAVSFNGKMEMDWDDAPASQAVRFRFDDDVIEWDVDFEREDDSQVPFALPFPVYVTARETVILPNGGAGFILDGEHLEYTIAGTFVSRQLSLDDGRAAAFSTFRRLKHEVSAFEAAGAKDEIEAIDDDKAYVRSPADYAPSAAEIEAIVDGDAETADALVKRGYHLMQQGRLESAVADFEEAAALSPEWSLPRSNLGLALVLYGEYEKAEAFLAEAASLDASDFVLHQAYGMLHLARDKPAEAVRAFTRSLQSEPGDSFSLFQRAVAYEYLGDLDNALTDMERLLELEPGHVLALWHRARLKAAVGDEEGALAAAQAAIAHSSDGLFLGLKGELLVRFGRKEEAAKAFTAAVAHVDAQLSTATDDRSRLIAQKISLLSAAGRHAEAIETAAAELREDPDNATLLISRCHARAAASIELELALEDCNLALEYNPVGMEHDPETVAALSARGLLFLRMENWDAAIAEYEVLLSYVRQHPDAHFGLAIAKLRRGDSAGGEEDLDLARRYGFDIDAHFRSLGITPYVSSVREGTAEAATSPLQ